jgi:hypothetical protein
LVVREQQFILLEGGEVDLEELLVVLLEDFLRVEIAGHEEVEKTPKFDESILDGSACEDEPMESVEFLDSLKFESFNVLDEMAFEEDRPSAFLNLLGHL